MARVDMSPARQAICKRHKRRRRMARRHLHKARRQQHREFIAAETARLARCAAVAKWTEEEKKREQQRTLTPQSPRKTLVKFANDVFVTEIPAHVGDRLPKPVTSPVGVSIADAPALRFRDRVQTVKFVTINDDWSDQSDDDERDPEFVPKSLAGDDALGGTPHSSQRIQPLRQSVKGVLSRARAHGESAADGIPPFKNGCTSKNHTQRTSSNALADASSSKSTSNAIKCSPRKTGDSSKKLSPKDRPVASKKSSERSKSDLPPAPTSSLTSNLHPGSHQISQLSSKPASLVKSTPVHNSTPPENRKKKKRKLNHHADILPPSLPSSDATSRSKFNTYINGHATATTHASGPSLEHENGSFAKDATLSSKQDSDKEEIDNMFVDLVKLRAVKKTADSSKLGASVKQNEAVGKAENGKTRKVGGGPTKYTEDGLRIVTYEEMAADQPKGLNGPCPFDCSCCL